MDRKATPKIRRETFGIKAFWKKDIGFFLIVITFSNNGMSIPLQYERVCFGKYMLT